MQLPDVTNWSISQRIEWLKQCTPQQLDAVCKQCGLCCLKKAVLSSLDIPGILYTYCACRHLKLPEHECSIYCDRLKPNKAHCCKVSLDIVLNGELVPRSCGYGEFIYRPCELPININWERVKNTPDDAYDEMLIINNIIQHSNHWNHGR